MYGNEYNQHPPQLPSLGKLDSIPEPMKSIPSPIPQGQLAYPAYQHFAPEVPKNFSQTSYIQIPTQRAEGHSQPNGFMPMNTMHVSFPQLHGQKPVMPQMGYPLEAEYMSNGMAMYQSNPKASQEFYTMPEASRGNPQMPVMFVPQYHTMQTQMPNPPAPMNYYNHGQVPYQAPGELRKEKTLNKSDLNKFLKDDFDELEEFYQKYEKDMPVKIKTSEQIAVVKPLEKTSREIKENFGDLSAIQPPSNRKAMPPAPPQEPELPNITSENLLPSTIKSQDMPITPPDDFGDDFELPNESVHLPIGEADDDSLFSKDSFLLNASNPGIQRSESRLSLPGHSVLISVDDLIETEVPERNRRDQRTSWDTQKIEESIQNNENNGRNRGEWHDEFKEGKNNFSKKNPRHEQISEIAFEGDDILSHDISGIQKIEEKRVYPTRHKSTANEHRAQETGPTENQEPEESATTTRSRPARFHDRRRRVERQAEDVSIEESGNLQNEQVLPSSRTRNRREERVEDQRETEKEESEIAPPKTNSRYNNVKKPQPVNSVVEEDERPLAGAKKTFEQILQEELAKEKGNQAIADDPPVRPQKTPARTNKAQMRNMNSKHDEDDQVDIPVTKKKVKNFIDDDRPINPKASRNFSPEEIDEPERPNTNRKKIQDDSENGSKTDRSRQNNLKGNFSKNNNPQENQATIIPLDDQPLPTLSAKKNPAKPNPVENYESEEQDSLAKPSYESTKKPVARKPKPKLTRKQMDVLDWLRKFYTEDDFVPNFIEQCQDSPGFWGFVEKVKEMATSSPNQGRLQETIAEYQKKHETLTKENQELGKNLEAIKKERNELLEKSKAITKNHSMDHSDPDRSLNETGLLEKEGKQTKTLEAKSSRREQQENEALRTRIRRLEEATTAKETLYKETIDEKNKQISDLNSKLKEALNLRDDSRAPSSKNIRKTALTNTAVSQRNVSPIKSSTNRNVSPIKTPKNPSTTTSSTNPTKKTEAESVESESKDKTQTDRSLPEEPSVKSDANVKEEVDQSQLDEKAKAAKEQQEKLASITVEGLKLNDNKKKYFSKKKERISNVKMTAEINEIIEAENMKKSDPQNEVQTSTKTETEPEKTTGDSKPQFPVKNTESNTQKALDEIVEIHAQMKKSSSRQSQLKLNHFTEKTDSQISTNRESRNRLADLSSIVRDTILGGKIDEQDGEENQEEEPSKKALPDPKRLTKAFAKQQIMAMQILDSFDNPLPIAKIFTEKLDNDSYHYRNNKFYKDYQTHTDSQSEIVKVNRLQDGKIQNIFDNKVQEILFTNGSRRVIFPNGYTLVFFGNGDIKQSLPDSTVIYYYADQDATQTTLPNNIADVGLLDFQVRRHSGRIPFQQREQRNQVG
jgi:hypothetical protein